MPRSKFRLEPLLKIRQLDEDRAKRVVAERLREIQKVQQQAEALDQQQVEAIGTMRSLVLTGRIVPLEASRQRGYIGSLQVQRFAIMAQLQGLQARLAVERVALAEASKRRKILDKLKERQAQRLLARQNRDEQRAGDELGVLRFAHEQMAVAGETDAAFEALQDVES